MEKWQPKLSELSSEYVLRFFQFIPPPNIPRAATAATRLSCADLKCLCPRTLMPHYKVGSCP